MGEAAMQAAGTWCRWCGEPVRLLGDTTVPRELRKAVHEGRGEGREKGPDGHLAAPITDEPPLWKAAREITADYRGVFTVTARLGILRADWAPAAVRPGMIAEHYTADDEESLRHQLDRAVEGTPWARESAGS